MKRLPFMASFLALMLFAIMNTASAANTAAKENKSSNTFVNVTVEKANLANVVQPPAPNVATTAINEATADMKKTLTVNFTDDAPPVAVATNNDAINGKSENVSENNKGDTNNLGDANVLAPKDGAAATAKVTSSWATGWSYHDIGVTGMNNISAATGVDFDIKI